MEVDYLDLKSLRDIVAFAVSNGDATNKEFYENVQRALQPFSVMLPLLEFAKNSKIILPFQLAMDLNSVVKEFGDSYV